MMKARQGRSLLLTFAAPPPLAGALLTPAPALGTGLCRLLDQFPATGQTTAYTADKNNSAGQDAVPGDGTVQAGATLRYRDNGNGTITDKNTLLIWEKKNSLDSTPDLSNLHDADNTYLWSGDGAEETIWDWLDDVNAEGGTGFAGRSDWRIPNVKELQSIVDYENANPAVDPVFGDTASDYWSSSTLTVFPTSAWFVNFVDGFVNLGGKSSNTIFVRAVRGGCR